MTTTTTAPAIAARPADVPTTRQYIRYLFYKARSSWRMLPSEQREAARAELLAVIEPFVERLAVLRAFSTLGTRGDCDFLLWTVSDPVSTDSR